jgi:hypothetical protein
MMEEQFRAVLLASAPLATLVPADKIVFGDVLQGRDYPLIAMLTVSGAVGVTMQGPDGLLQARVQVDCYARTMLQAKQIGGAVVGALHCYRGGQFQGIFHESTRDSREGATNEADRPFRTSLDFMAHWQVVP